MLFFLFSYSLCITINPSEERSFINWMRETKNFYVGEDYHFRFGVWLANYRYVQSKSSSKTKSHFKCGMNSLSALSPSEYRALLGTINNRQSKGENVMGNSPSTINKIKNLERQLKDDKKDYPDNLDYRTHEPSVLNPIQDIGQCSGGSWSFSITCAVETSHAIKKNELFKLSEQCLIDCDTYCDGCNSGSLHSAYLFLTNNEDYQCHINSEADYPWTGSKGECKFDFDKALFLFSGVFWGNEKPESDMILYLNDYGVGSVSLDASSAAFQLYTSGIYEDKNCGKTSNLAVTVVGYGIEGSGDDAVPYWICRNCWGTSWGEEGYFRIIRGSDECGIADEFFFPVKFF